MRNDQGLSSRTMNKSDNAGGRNRCLPLVVAEDGPKNHDSVVRHKRMIFGGFKPVVWE